MVKALIIKTDGTTNVENIEPELEVFKEIVGGWIEAINRSEWHAYIDEEGKLKKLAVNPQATALMRALGWATMDVICGPAVFLGTDHEQGNELDVPEGVITFARGLGLLSDE